MATETETETPRRSLGSALSRALEGWNLDALVATLSLVMVFGIALDFRAHTGGLSFEEEGFFTPEHVFFYTAFLCIGAVICAAVFRNRLRTGSWRSSVPSGYAIGLAGVALFAFGGVGDFFWHNAFGFEEGIEGLTSPSHLTLATGAILFFSSPLRSSFRRAKKTSGWSLTPSLISMSLVVTILTIFTLYINPIIRSTANTRSESALGIVSLFAFPTILLGAALILMSRFDLPVGALAFTFAVTAFLSTAVGGNFILALPAIAAGLVGDLINRYYISESDSVLPLRAFGALVPATFVIGYLAVVNFRWIITWTVHIWAGAVFLAAAAGLLLTYVVIPDGGMSTSRLSSRA